MANPTSRGRGTGSPARGTMTAAARAAAKRTRRAEPQERRVRAEHEQRPGRGQGPDLSVSGEDGTRAVAGPARKPADEAPGRTASRPAGRTTLIEVPDSWDDPPEPATQSEEAPDEVPEETPEETPEESAPARRPGRRLLTMALCVALVAGLVAVAVLGWQYREGQGTEQARGQALAAARKAAPVVLSYDYRHLDRDFARARDHLTGAFRDEYGRTTKTVVGPTARKYHGVVKATVAAPSDGAADGTPAASVVSAAPDRAVVLLFVNQVTRSTQVSGSRVDLNRVRMTLTRTSDGWKVSAVDAL